MQRFHSFVPEPDDRNIHLRTRIVARQIKILLSRLIPGLSLFVFGAVLLAQNTLPPSLGQADKDYLPIEMQPTDPEIKSDSELANKLSEQGEYKRAVHVLEEAHDLSIRKGLRNDRALMENRLARVKILNGDLSGAKNGLLAAEALTSETGNLVLEADILAGLSRLARINREVKASLDLIDKALDLATKGKNLWIQAYCLGEKANLQLSEGQLKDARANLEEALRIDRLNHYPFESQHSLDMALLVFISGEDPARGIEWANKARELAIKAEDFGGYMQASTTLAGALALRGDLQQGLDMVQQARDGAATFHDLSAYRKYVSLPINQAAILEAQESCYSIAKRNDDALRISMELYSLGVASNIPFAAAEGAQRVADRYRGNKDLSNAAKWYGVAVEAWGKSDNRERQMDAMASEAAAFNQDHRQEEAISEVQKLILIAQENKDVRREFIERLSLAELYTPSGNPELYKKALLSAEALLPESLTIPGVTASMTVELFSRLAALHGSEGKEVDQLTSLEKELFLAGPRQKTAFTLALDQEIKGHIESLHLPEKAETAYKNGDPPQALLDFELVQKFQEYDAAQNGKKYNEHFDDPIMNKLGDIAFRMGSQKDGPEILEANLHEMGPLAAGVWFASDSELTHSYSRQNQSEKVIHYGSIVWPYLDLKAPAKPQRNDVLVACELSIALYVRLEVNDAVQKARGCLSGAEALGDPGLLVAAHNLNVTILTKAGKAELAEGSVEYLRSHPVHDLPALLAIAAGQGQAGDWKGQLTTLESALAISEAASEQDAQTATLHLQIANLIATHEVKDELGQEGHLQQAEALYKKLGDNQSRANTLLELAAFYISQHNWKQAEASLHMAVQLAGKHSEQEAQAESLEGDRQRAMSAPDKALAAYREAARLYHEIGDKANESGALFYLARTLVFDQKKPGAALDVLNQASQLAEQSKQWDARVDALRLLALVDQDLGNYPGALDALRDALRVSNRDGVPLFSARIELQICDALIAVGEWEEALRSANDALPVLRRSGTKDDLFSTYATLIDIYSGRGSSLQDFDKALSYVKQVKADLGPFSESQLAVLSLDTFEIHFQQGNFNQAILDARTALSYGKAMKDFSTQAYASLSLSEALQASGDATGAVDALAQARPLTEQAHDFYLSGRQRYVQANLYRREGKLDQATDSYEQVIGLLEGVKAGSGATLQGAVSESYDYIYGELIDAYLLRGQKLESYRETAAEKAFGAAELNKARIFTSTWGRSLMEGLRQKLPADLQEEERTIDERRSSLEGELNRQPTGEGRSRQQVEAELEKLADEEKTFQAKLRKSYPVYATLRYPGRMKISDLPLRPGEVLVEFKMFQTALFVWIIQGTDSGPQVLSFYPKSGD